LTAPIVRNASKETKRAVTKALRDGSMRVHLRALNSLQNVAFRINTRIFDVVKWRHDHFDDVVIKRTTEKLKVITKRGKKIKIRTGKWVEVSDIRTVNDDLAVAERFSGAPFYNDMNLDNRGRFYSLPHFHFGRRDCVRAMILFADAKPLGEEGVYWLKSLVASLGGFDGIGRRPFDERASWADANMELIHWAADNPRESHQWWSQAGKRFQFLAALMELSAAMRAVDPAAFESRLPIPFDCTTSGLQHLAAMSRDEGRRGPGQSGAQRGASKLL
jgi:DNA-directed RNA polymerase